MIEVGEYVRTKYGIAKVIKNSTSINDYFIYYDIDKEFDNVNYIMEEEIVKHSKNIIDILEVRRFCKWLSSKKNTKF